MKEAFPDRFYVRQPQEGRRGGQDRDLTYESGTPEVDPEVAALFTQGDAPLTEEQVRDRALTALAEEVQLML